MKAQRTRLNAPCTSVLAVVALLPYEHKQWRRQEGPQCAHLCMQ